MAGLTGARGARIAAIAICVVLATIGSGMASVAADPASGAPVAATAPADDPFVRAQNGTVTPVRHVDPETADDRGDIEQLGAWLGDHLSERLAGSAARLDDEDFERARAMVGPDYRRLLGQYVSLADETETPADDRAARSFHRAGGAQRAFVREVESYRETHREFREAERGGDRVRMLRLGHELERVARDVNQTGSAVSQSYRSVSNTTGADLTASRRVVNRTVANVTDQQAAVRDSVFTGTRIEVTVASRQISYVTPLLVTGRLVSENGTSVVNGTILIDAGPEQVRTQTDRTGRFTLRYRPTLLPLDADTVSIRFVPANTSAYLGSNATIPVAVKPVTPTLTITRATDQVSFGRPYAVAGRVTVDGLAVSGVPVSIQIGDQNLGTVRATDRGFRRLGQLPAAVPPGEQTVHVQLPFENRALATNAATEEITVTETPIRLALEARTSGADELAVSGRLTTDRRWPVPQQVVTVAIDGTVVGRARTSETGTFATTVSLPASADGASSVHVEATAGGSGTNLAPATANTSVALPIPPEPGDQSGWIGRFEWWHWVLLCGVAGGLGLVATRLLRRLGVRPLGGLAPEPSRQGQPDSIAAATDPRDSVQASDRPAGSSLLEAAHAALEAGQPDAAVTAAYAAVRQTVGGRLGVPGSVTHWEFLATAGEDGFEDRSLGDLESLTAVYEQAAFAADSTSPVEAEEALKAARAVAEAAVD